MTITITYYNALGEVIGTVVGNTESAANVARDLITVGGAIGAPLTCNAEALYTTLTANL